MVDCNAIMRNYSRYMLIIFNFFFVITGVIITSIGVSVKAYYNEFEHLLDDKYFYVSDLLIVIGIIIFIISFFGCCGAVKENACLTTTFSTLLIIIFILELVVGIGGVILKNKTEGFLVVKLKESMKLYNKNTTDENTRAWDIIQNEMKCCGVLSYSDWHNVTILNNTLPLSCCDIPFGTAGSFTCDDKSSSLHKDGCLAVFGEKIRDNTSSIEVAGLTLALLQLMGIILSCYLAKHIRGHYERV